MKVLFTHGYFIHEDEKELKIMRPYVPLGILYISAYLEQNHYPNSVFDSTFSSFEDLCDELLKTKPDVVGIYTNLITKLNVLRIIWFIKTRPQLNHTSIVLGGPEVRNHVGKFLEHGADYLVLGEGEQTMLELVQCIDGKYSGTLGSIDGIAYKDKDNNVQQNRERAKLKSLEELPLPNTK